MRCYRAVNAWASGKKGGGMIPSRSIDRGRAVGWIGTLSPLGTDEAVYSARVNKSLPRPCFAGWPFPSKLDLSASVKESVWRAKTTTVSVWKLHDVTLRRRRARVALHRISFSAVLAGREETLSESTCLGPFFFILSR